MDLMGAHRQAPPDALNPQTSEFEWLDGQRITASQAGRVELLVVLLL
jgi:hypothetical protein